MRRARYIESLRHCAIDCTLMHSKIAHRVERINASEIAHRAERIKPLMIQDRMQSSHH